MMYKDFFFYGKFPGALQVRKACHAIERSLIIIGILTYNILNVYYTYKRRKADVNSNIHYQSIYQ